MELLSPAKINLYLQVTGKRDDGYHELIMLMSAISLYDKIRIETDKNEYSLKCPHPDVPENESNIALRAAILFRERLGSGRPVSIHLEKNIPVGAGLGGGSSNAATVLKGLNVHYDYPFSDDALLEMGAELGSDVPFFIHSKPAWAVGRGEKIVCIENIACYKVIVLFPGVHVSTPAVYKKLNFGLTKNEKKIKSPLLNKGLVDPINHLFNDLEEPAIEICSEIKNLKDVLSIHGAEGILMSGSGSSVFGLYSETSAAKEAYDTLKSYMAHHEGCRNWQVFLTEMII